MIGTGAIDWDLTYAAVVVPSLTGIALINLFTALTGNRWAGVGLWGLLVALLCLNVFPQGHDLVLPCSPSAGSPVPSGYS